MRAIRAEMRRHRAAGISVSQFRALIFLGGREGASLSDVADHIGLTLPSMSKMVDGLVERRLVHREDHPDDRRRNTLSLTRQGREIAEAARAATLFALAARLRRLSPVDRGRVARAMDILRPLFEGHREAGVHTKR
jgi:DNA-binding MarR family transcriptional regulator